MFLQALSAIGAIMDNGLTTRTGSYKMRWTLAITTVLLSLNANATQAPIADQVVKDLYFLSAQCDKYLDGLTDQERSVLTESSSLTERNESLRYVAGKDSILADFQELFKREHLNFNTNLTQMKDKLKKSTDLTSQYEDQNYSEQLYTDSLEEWKKIVKAKKTAAQKDEIKKFTWCRIAVVAAGMGINAAYPKKYVEFALSRPNTATIGYFQVMAERGEYRNTVGTGNQFSEPKTWDGSRFYIVHASFKNLDTESRLPVEGSLFINYDGKDYEFDSVEPILTEGYNIWFRKINPLVTMKTKLVYRIPDEIHGDVYWRPGRNSDDKRLWVGVVKAAEKT